MTYKDVWPRNSCNVNEDMQVESKSSGVPRTWKRIAVPHSRSIIVADTVKLAQASLNLLPLKVGVAKS